MEKLEQWNRSAGIKAELLIPGAHVQIDRVY